MANGATWFCLENLAPVWDWHYKNAPEQVYVGLSWGYVGATFAHLGAILELCWPSEGDFGLSCFHDFPFIPKFSLRKLPPLACEAPRASRFAPTRGVRVARISDRGGRRWFLSPKPCPCLGLALQKCPLDRSMLADLEAMLEYVGAMFTHLGAILGLGWPSGGDFGLSCSHDFTFIPKFCLKKLPPVACESHV